MCMIEVDYLIVGAGLAGTIVGYLLSKMDARVLCLELRDARTKDKLCAGMVSDTTLSSIARIFGEDALSRIEDSGPLPCRYRSLGFERCYGNSTRTVCRKKIDDFCLERHLDAGGGLRDRVRLVGRGRPRGCEHGRRHPLRGAVCVPARGILCGRNSLRRSDATHAGRPVRASEAERGVVSPVGDAYDA